MPVIHANVRAAMSILCCSQCEIRSRSEKCGAGIPNLLSNYSMKFFQLFAGEHPPLFRSLDPSSTFLTGGGGDEFSIFRT